MQFMFTNERVRIMHQLTNCNDGRIVTGFRFENCDIQLQGNEQKQIHSWIVVEQVEPQVDEIFSKEIDKFFLDVFK